MMKKISGVLIFLLLQFGCATREIAKLENSTPTIQAQIIANIPPQDDVDEKLEKEYQDAIKNYPGKTIDQVFPVIEDHDFQDKNFDGKSYSVNVGDFQIAIKNFAPKTIKRNEKVVFRFKTLYNEGYWANMIGTSNLLGKNSKELYVVVSGTGGVCCTNYWITDVSNKTPRNIFRSEDFGYFRDPMEIFDADGDGIYELVQFDSTFRYFMDDCGSCSPEPRAVFKYDKKTRTYLPAKGIQQEFVKEGFSKTQKWLAETFEKLKTSGDPGEELNFHRSLLAHIVDLFYLGEERKAWKTFDKYFPKGFNKKKTRAEIESRLRGSKYYLALRKHP
jgi:hypothetical protein